MIKQAYETRKVDGVDVEFHLVPGSEAPSEMIMYFPQFKLLNMAEDATHNMHNLYTLRGAEIRDGRLWSRYISDAIERYGDKTDVVIAQHHWPMWGNERIVTFLKKQRDLYKFIHDQSVRLMPIPGRSSDAARVFNMHSDEVLAVAFGDDNQHILSGSADILVDTRSFRQVILNIVGNAAKFTPSDGRIGSAPPPRPW